MKLRRSIPSCVLATILLAFCVVLACGTTLEDLLRRSDAVVFASAIGWSIVDTETLEVALRVEGKPVRGSVGDAVLLTHVRIGGADKSGPFRELPAGLWFLARHGDGWIAHPVTPRRLASVSNYVLPVSALEFQRDAFEPSMLEIAARAIEQVPLPLEAWNRRQVTSGLDSPAIRAAFERWRDATDATVSAFGASELLERGDVESIQRIQLTPERIAGLSGKARTMILSTIAQAFRSEDPAAIAALSALALDAKVNMDLRASAAHALSMMHSPQTLRTLAALLDDPVMELREKGCIGMGMFANGMPVHLRQHANSMSHLNHAGDSKYRTPEVSRYFGFDPAKESEFIHFWKDWWQRYQDDFP